jgi:predicted Zn finger-like uncharacterized protein
LPEEPRRALERSAHPVHTNDAEIPAMPIATQCTKCEAKFRLADQMAGKKVKCPKCGQILAVPKLDPEESPAEPKKPNTPPSVSNGNATVADDAVTTTPKRKAPPKRGDDEDDEEPRSKRKGDPDKPRRDEKPKAKSGMSGAMMALIGVGVLSCLCCVGAGPAAYFMLDIKPGPQPKPVQPIPGLDKIAMDKPADPKDIPNIDLIKDFKDKFDGFKDFKDKDKLDGLKDKDKFDGFQDRPKLDANKDGFKDKKNPGLPGAINVVFGADGSFRSDNVLSQKDPIGIMGKPHKTYFAQVEAGYQYQIDLMSPEFDCYLYLLDNNNKLVLSDDDSGDGLNSRIEFKAGQTGLYRIEAASLGIGQGKFTFTVRRVSAVPKVEPPPIPVPKKEVVNTSIVTKSSTSGAFIIKELNHRIPFGSPITTSEPVWDAEGKYLYWLQASIVLNKIRQSDLVIEASASLPQPCHHLGISAEGLVALSSNTTEIWVFDPNDLALRKKIPVPGQSWLGASRATSTAIVAGAGMSLSHVDLKDGKHTPMTAVKAPTNLANLLNVSLTPDGRTLLVQALDYSCHRFQIQGAQLIHQAAKPATSKIPLYWTVSPDSKYVAWASPGKGSVKSKTLKTTEVFAMENWNDPVLTLPYRAREVAIGGMGNIYACDDKGDVHMYSMPLKKADVFDTWRPTLAVRRIFPAPRGYGAVVSTPSQTYWIDLAPKK